ncbi:Alkylmercury lyase [Clostridium frigidicarnis]|uniref:Alkylmercury lyase n=2 Tax=Clostridium frigidicarnis TaxID=84698 RepID=A0A1I1B0Z2_9CLOT|nr:Alkylmercury lyase [Clostridium frigidicarnis]
MKELYMNEYKGFKNYDFDEVYRASICSKMSLKEEKLRRFFMDYIIEEKQPFELDSIDKYLDKLQLEKKEVKKLVKSIEEKEGLWQEDGFIKFVYPVSSIETNHRVRIEDGREFFAMCAIDAMGSHFTFDKNIKINSKCSECGQEIFVEINNGEVVECQPSSLNILHVNTEKFTEMAKTC